MKRIRVDQINGLSMTLLDKDDSPLEEYTDQLSQILNSGNVCTIITSEHLAIVRPSQISGVLIEEYDDLMEFFEEPPKEKKIQKKETKPPVKKKKTKQQETEDFITDV